MYVCMYVCNACTCTCMLYMYVHVVLGMCRNIFNCSVSWAERETMQLQI